VPAALPAASVLRGKLPRRKLTAAAPRSRSGRCHLTVVSRLTGRREWLCRPGHTTCCGRLTRGHESHGTRPGQSVPDTFCSVSGIVKAGWRRWLLPGFWSSWPKIRFSTLSQSVISSFMRRFCHVCAEIVVWACGCRQSCGSGIHVRKQSTFCPNQAAGELLRPS